MFDHILTTLWGNIDWLPMDCFDDEVYCHIWDQNFGSVILDAPTFEIYIASDIKTSNYVAITQHSIEDSFLYNLYVYSNRMFIMCEIVQSEKENIFCLSIFWYFDNYNAF